MKSNGSWWDTIPQFVRQCIHMYNSQIQQMIDNYHQYRHLSLTSIGYSMRFMHTQEIQQIPTPLFRLVTQKMEQTQRCTTLSGTFAIDISGADTHSATLSWKHENPNDELSPVYLQPFVFNYDIHIHLCDSMVCPCVCINYLLAHYHKNSFEATFQYLPIHVRDELKSESTFCQNLFHPVFNIKNGRRIINERQTENNDRQTLFLHCPTTHDKMDLPRNTTLNRPRKTSCNKKLARFPGNDEVPGGNTTSPNRRQDRRDTACYTNRWTATVASRNLMAGSAVKMLEAVSVVPRSAHNSDYLGEASDHPEAMMNATMIEHLLTQEIHLETSNNMDNGENAESVRKECRDDNDDDDDDNSDGGNANVAPRSSTGFNDAAMFIACHDGQRHVEQELQAVKRDSLKTNQAEIELRTKQAMYAHYLPLLDDVDDNADGYNNRHPNVRQRVIEGIRKIKNAQDYAEAARNRPAREDIDDYTISLVQGDPINMQQ